MTLKNVDLVTAGRYTSHYPLLLTGAAASGKSRALENMSAGDKKRTIVLNFDVKPLGTGDPGEFYQLYSVSSSSEPLDNHIAKLIAEGKQLTADGAKKTDPKMIYMGNMVKHLKQIKSTSYFIDDIESVDKLIKHILDSAFNPDVDRIIIDTLSAAIEFCDAYSNKNFNGHEIWGQYGTSLQKIMQAVKEVTIFGYKYSYVFAHHDYVAPAQYATTPKQVISVKGNIMKGNIEQHYSTVVYTYVTEEGKRMFECDNTNSLDTSRTKLVDGKFSFERDSLDDLEQIFALKKKFDPESGTLVNVN